MNNPWSDSGMNGTVGSSGRTAIAAAVAVAVAVVATETAATTGDITMRDAGDITKRRAVAAGEDIKMTDEDTRRRAGGDTRRMVDGTIKTTDGASRRTDEVLRKRPEATRMREGAMSVEVVVVGAVATPGRTRIRARTTRLSHHSSSSRGE